MAIQSSQKTQSNTPVFTSASQFATAQARPANTTAQTRPANATAQTRPANATAQTPATQTNVQQSTTPSGARVITNTNTGRTTTVTDVNKLTPLQKRLLARSLKSGSAQLGSRAPAPTSQNQTVTPSKGQNITSRSQTEQPKKTLTQSQIDKIRATYSGLSPLKAQNFRAQAIKDLGDKGFMVDESIFDISTPAPQQQTMDATSLSNRVISSLSGKNLTPDQFQKEAATMLAAELKAKREKGEKVSQQDLASVREAMNLVKSSSGPQSSALDTDNKTTIIAPNGKQYDVIKDPKTGVASFYGQDGILKQFNSVEDAKRIIDEQNPVGSTPMTSKNTPADVLPTQATSSKDGTPSTNLPSGQALIDQATSQKQENMSNLNETETKLVEDYTNLVDQSEDIDETQKGILRERMAGVFTSFNNINNILADLEQKSKTLFDAKATRAATARAQQMADKGYLMDDQVAAVAEYDLGNYRRDIEIQRAEIDKQIAEQKVALEQEKARLIDSVQKDSMLTEQQKLQQINYLNQVFSNLVSTISDKEMQVNNDFNQVTQNVLGQVFQQDVALAGIPKQAQAEIIAERTQREAANRDPNARTQYILNTLRQNAPDVVPFAQSAISGLISQQGVDSYLKTNLDNLIATIQRVARQSSIENQAALTSALK